MRAQLRAAGAFLKAVRWHLLLSPAYVVAATWIWNVPVLAACWLSGSDWTAGWYWGIFLEVAPRLWFDTGFQAWTGGLCAGLTALGAGLVRLLPARRLWLRRAGTICLVIFPAAIGLQWLNVFLINGMNPHPALWVPIALAAPAGLWLATGELARGVEALAGWRERAIPAAMLSLVVLLGIEAANPSSHAWQLGRLTHARITRGPLAAELLAFDLRMRSVHSAKAYRQVCEEHCRSLARLVEGRPDDPETPAARLRLARLAWGSLRDPATASQALAALRPEACPPETWAESRLLACRILSQAEPPDLPGALAELDRARDASIRGTYVAVQVQQYRAETLRRLGRGEEAVGATRAAAMAADAYAEKEPDEAGYIYALKAHLLVEGGLVPEAEAAMVRSLQLAKAEDPEGQAKRKVAGMVFAQAPVGRPAPELSGADLDGKTISLADYRGRYVLVDFWATWCGPCMGELPNLLAAHSRLEVNGVAILGVSSDRNREDLQKVVVERKIPWPNLWGEREATQPVRDAWGIRGIPANYLVGPDGKVVASNLRGKDLAGQVEAALRHSRADAGK